MLQRRFRRRGSDQLSLANESACLRKRRGLSSISVEAFQSKIQHSPGPQLRRTVQERGGFVLLKCFSSALIRLSVRDECHGHVSATNDLGRPIDELALDVWSAGTILMCILACKFPIFTASDDIEALMELAAVYGRRTMEKCGKLHSTSFHFRVTALNSDCAIGRTFATNVPSVDHEEMPWPELITRINPHLYQVDPSASSSWIRETVATPPKTAVRGAVAPHIQPQSQSQSQKSKTNTLPPSSQTSAFQSRPPSSQSQADSQIKTPPTKHNRLVDSALDLMSQCLHWDPTRRITSAEALQHPFLSEGPNCDVDADGDHDLGEWEGYNGGHGSA